MKSITELIKELEQIREDEGDINVFYFDQEYGEEAELELVLSSVQGNKILLVELA